VKLFIRMQHRSGEEFLAGLLPVSRMASTFTPLLAAKEWVGALKFNESMFFLSVSNESSEHNLM